MSHGTYIKPRTIEVAEENKGENINYFLSGEGLLDTTPKSRSMIKKIDKLYSIKI